METKSGVSRAKRALNITISTVLLQFIRSFIGLVIRWVFNQTLGDELLGLNSLFSSVLGFLALSELGIGAAVSVYLYEGLAKEDYDQVRSYLRLLRISNRIVGFATLLIGIGLTPIVIVMVKGDYNIQQIVVGYWLCICASASTYFLWAEQSSIFIADQRQYVNSLISGLVYIVVSCMQIVTLFVYKNYYVFLILNLLNNVVYNVIMHYFCIRDYPNLQMKSQPLSKVKKREFWNKWKGVIIYRISNYLIQSTDNIVISILLGTVVVAYYNNYALIFNMLFAIFATMSSSVMAGLGNMYYTDSERMEITIRNLSCVQHFIFSITAVAMICLSTDFVSMLFGEKSELSWLFVIIQGLAYYYYGYFNLFESVRGGIGAYENDKWLLLGLSIINVVLSITASMKIGVAGVMLGTLVVYLVRGGILTPYQIFRNNLMTKGRKSFYKGLIKNSCLLLIELFISLFIISHIDIDNKMYDFGIKGLICCGITLLFNIIVYGRTNEFRNVLQYIKVIKS